MKTLYILLLISVLTPLAFAQEPLDQLRGKEYIAAREEIIAGKRELVVTGEGMRSYIAKESVSFRKENPKFNTRLNYIETNTGHYPFGRGSFAGLWLNQVGSSGKGGSSVFLGKTEFFDSAPQKQDQIRLIAEAIFFEVFPMKVDPKYLIRKRGGLRSFIYDLGDAVKNDTELTPELKAKIISAVISEYNAANINDLAYPLKSLPEQVYELMKIVENKYHQQIATSVIAIMKLSSGVLLNKLFYENILVTVKKEYNENQQLMEFLAEKAVADKRLDIIMPFIKVYEKNFKLILDYDKCLSTNFAEQLLITLKSLNEKTPNDDLAESIEYMTTTIAQYTPNPDNVIETEKKLKRK